MNNYIETETGKRILTAFLKTKKASSKKVYLSEIKQFFSFFTGGLSDLQETDFIAYRNYLDSKVSAKTIKRKMSILNGFFKFVEKKSKGFKSVIGKRYGSLSKLQSQNYAESDEFKSKLAAWCDGMRQGNTKKTYSNNTRLFFQWCRCNPKDLKQSDFIRYKKFVIDNGLNISTIWLRFIAINGYLNFLARNNSKFDNPLHIKNLGLKPIPKGKDAYTILDEKKLVDKILRQPDRRTLIGTRDFLVLCVFIFTGARIGEVLKIKYKHIENPILIENKSRLWLMNRKGHSRRENTGFLLKGKLFKALKSWLKKSKIDWQPDTPLFIGFQPGFDGVSVINQTQVINKAFLDSSTIHYRVKKYITMAGLKKVVDTRLSSHSFRHTFGTRQSKLVSLPQLQKMMAHQNIADTVRYTHTRQKDIDQAMINDPFNE